jgi:hypothetical protein
MWTSHYYHSKPFSESSHVPYVAHLFTSAWGSKQDRHDSFIGKRSRLGLRCYLPAFGRVRDTGMVISWDSHFCLLVLSVHIHADKEGYSNAKLSVGTGSRACQDPSSAHNPRRSAPGFDLCGPSTLWQAHLPLRQRQGSGARTSLGSSSGRISRLDQGFKRTRAKCRWPSVEKRGR